MTQLEPQSSVPSVILELIVYDRTFYERYENYPVEELLQKIDLEKVNWINVDGLSDQQLIARIQSHFNLHPLLVEDVLTDQRPKAEEYDEYLYFSMKMLYKIEEGAIEYEQISFVMGPHYLITFQEKEGGDLFNAFRERVRMDIGRVRKRKADYLLYRLIDIVVDNYYVILDAIGDQIEETEESLHDEHSDAIFKKIQQLKKELIYLRKAVNPLRDAISTLIKDKSEFIDEENERYYSDVYDHVVHLMDSLDTYKDLTSGLMDFYINSMNNQLNKVIKVLTIISTIFIPLTFVVGVYGMNFRHMPELEWTWGYPMVWGVMVLMTVSMLLFFKYKKWN